MADEVPANAAAQKHAQVPRTEPDSPAQATEIRLVLPPGVPALGFAIASMASCFGFGLVEAFLGMAPYSLGMNPHLQAVFMWGLGLMAVYALWQDRSHHHNNLPVALGAVAVAVLVATLYIRYFVQVEALAYVLLVVAAFLNLTIFLVLLNRTVQRQCREIRVLNQGLEARVESQVREIDRLARLKQFLAPQIAELVVSDGEDKRLETHRRYIACVFCDIRDFTALSEEIEPEEVIAILQGYHDSIGALVAEHRGTIGYRAGDGLMAFFNDPAPCAEPVLDAVRLALDIRAAFAALRTPWTKRGHVVGLGIGIASGYATLGLIGFQGRADYTAIGGAVNVASRLCDKATDGQILITQRAYLDVEMRVQARSLGILELKGVKHATEVYDVVGLSQAAA
jgi:class 3 adenylate cyclase